MMQHEETDSGRIRAALGRAGVRGAFSDEATQGLGLGASTAGAQVPSLVGELRSCCRGSDESSLARLLGF